jgi:chromatin remodeling complex protein RSC6
MAAKKGGKKAAKKGGAKKGGAKKKAAAKKPAAKKKSAAKKRTPNAAFMAPKQPDAALAAVVGSNPIPRTEITKKLWGYIKKNGLQDAKERRMINADDKLKPVFGGKSKVSMFEMTKLVNKHIK